MTHQVLCSNQVHKRVLTNERAMHLVFFLICIIPLMLSALITTDGTYSTVHFLNLHIPMRGICFFKLATGYRCPVCGMTRSFSYMSHEQIAAAWHMSHAGIAVYLLCIYESIYRFFRLVFLQIKFARVFKIIEIVLLVVTCSSVAFCFIVQFFNTALVY